MRVRDDESHRRLSEALTDIAVGAVHPARHLGVGCSAPEGMFEDSIESATQAAVETLVSGSRISWRYCRARRSTNSCMSNWSPITASNDKAVVVALEGARPDDSPPGQQGEMR